MAGIHTPFAAAHQSNHRSSLDGGPSSREQPNNAARQMSNGLMLDDSFNLPSCPSLDDFLMHATQGFMDTAAAQAQAQRRPGSGSGALHPFPSRLLTLSTGKSLSAMASLDLSWLADGPAGAQQAQHGGPFSRAQSMQRKPSLAEQLVGPEQLGSKELPSVLPLNIENGLPRPLSASGSLPLDKNMNINNSQRQSQTNLSSSPNPTPTPPSSPSYAVPATAEAAFYQLHAAHAALLEAQAAYLKVLETNNASNNTADPSSTTKNYEQIAAAQQHLAMKQSYFAAALVHAQQYQQQQQIACGLPPTDLSNFAGGVQMPFNNNANHYTPLGLIPLGSNGVPSSAPPQQQHPFNPNTTTMSHSGGFLNSSFAPQTPSQTRASAMAQWEQERALMQALNSSDMETAVQAFSGILSVAGGGNGSGGDINFPGPCGVPQHLLHPTGASPSTYDHNMFGAGSGGVSSGASAPLSSSMGDGSRSQTPPLSMTVKINSGVQPMVCVTHAQPIKVSCTSPPSSPMRVEQHQ